METNNQNNDFQYYGAILGVTANIFLTVVNLLQGEKETALAWLLASIWALNCLGHEYNIRHKK